MKAIIFGANGQDGYYLTQLLTGCNVTVLGVSQRRPFVQVDLVKSVEVNEVVKDFLPDYIFHLAADSTTRHEALLHNHNTISTGTINILEAVRLYAPQARVFISGSGLQFQNLNAPIKETDPFEARDAYSVSRIHSVYAARYFRSLGVQAYVGYFFNHDSPLRSERHMAKKISEAARRISSGSKEILEIGDMSVIKEWTFAGDVVTGIWKFINQDQIVEANIGSGLGYSIAEWLEACFQFVSLDYRDYVIERNDFKPEYKQLVSDASRIHSLGFQPKVSFKDLAAMMITK